MDTTRTKLTEGESKVFALVPPGNNRQVCAYDFQISGIGHEDLDIWVSPSGLLDSFRRVGGCSELDGLGIGSFIYFFPRKTAEIAISCMWRDSKKDQ